ncbi:hypothetical protein DL95DRAFT_383073 [Leptodontidium sp. 2 PMI_412]|nr:hypothetical protein DL95DRAFT_383073 [Leptodontidium sp. 2 PMI_412]
MAASALPLSTLPTPTIHILPRGISADNKINIIIGVLTIVIGILSSMLAWSTWRLTRDRRRRHGHMSPAINPIPLEHIPHRLPRLGYELALRFGRSD